MVFFASRISCGQHECPPAVDVDDGKTYCNRDERVRRLGRWFHAAENLGIVVGALIASLLFAMCSGDQCTIRTLFNYSSNQSDLNGVGLPPPAAVIPNGTNGGGGGHGPVRRDLGYYEWGYGGQQSTATVMPPDRRLDRMFQTNEQGGRICGVDSCPITRYYFDSDLNVSTDGPDNDDGAGAGGSSFQGKIPIIVIYIALAVVAIALTILMQHIDNGFKCDTIRGMTDTLLFAGPMSYFIGTEQGYVLGDFMKVSIFIKIKYFIISYTYKN